MFELPVNSEGSRLISLNTGHDYLTFRTYFTAGQKNSWLLDIRDGNLKPLVSGVNLITGSDNVIKGQGDKLKDYQLFVALHPDFTADDQDGLGNSLRLFLYLPGEENLYKNGDPLEHLEERFNEFPLA